VLLGGPLLRLRAEYFGISTLSLIFVLQLLAMNVEYTGGATGIWMRVPAVSVGTLKLLFFEAMLGVLAVTQLCAVWIAATKLGYGLRCIREDEDVAEIIGVQVFTLKMAAWVISSFFIGIAGGMYAVYTSYIDPTGVFDVAITINMILMCLLGGMRRTFGPLIGAALLVLVSEMVTVLFVSEAKLLIFGALLVVVVLAFPDGIVSRWRFSPSGAPKGAAPA
jgi:branched-chain amino acid transport system permease protein